MSTTSTSALSGLLSALNNGSTGIDVNSAVASVIYADRAPERVWQAQQATLNSQTSALQQLESEASAVTVALQSLGDANGTFSSVITTSSNTGIVTASAAAGTPPGNHTVEVDSLAVTGSAYSTEQSSSSATLPSGSIALTGATGSSTFATGSGGAATLDDLAAAINTASLGVNASVVNDANGARLALVASSPGTAGDFSITSDTGLQLTKTAAQNASLIVDGVPVSSSSNTVTGAVAGLTLNLQGASQGTQVSVGVTADNSSIETAVATFTNAYNTLIKDLNSQFTFDSSTSSEGILSSDSTARALQNDVLSAANLSVGSGTFTSLASLGISTNQDGTLSVDSQALSSALSTDPQGVSDFFQGTSSDTGFASSVISTFSNYTDPSQGSFTVDLQSLASENQDLTDQTNTFELYIATQQTVLTAEYNNANIALQQLPQQIKQVDALLGQNSSGSNG